MFLSDLSLGKLYQIKNLHCILVLTRFTVYISMFKGYKFRKLRNEFALFCSIQYFPSLFDHKTFLFLVNVMTIVYLEKYLYMKKRK